MSVLKIKHFFSFCLILTTLLRPRALAQPLNREKQRNKRRKNINQISLVVINRTQMSNTWHGFHWGGMRKNQRNYSSQ